VGVVWFPSWDVVKSFFGVEMFLMLCRVDETKNRPWEMTWVRDISEDRTMKMVECGRMLRVSKLCLRGVVSVVGSVVVCILTFWFLLIFICSLLSVNMQKGL
jgi:hypothetical protein